jgi:dihydroorotate dehydrogenase (NAD+) catalytic subunit
VITSVGSVTLAHPVLTASGTAGHGAELAAYNDLSAIGAVVVKSLAHFAWEGNPPLRVHATTGDGMLNSVGLQGPGVEAWVRHDLPPLLRTGASVVVSIWGRSVEDYARAADLLSGLPEAVVAVEVNLSCPNTESGRDLFAHDPEATAAVLAATAGAGRPRWAKLSPNTNHLVEVAAAAQRAGAEAVTLINTVLGMVIDPLTGAYVLGSAERGGGLSGPPVHPIAVRAVHDVHRALPALPVVGVGGVTDGLTALELLRAGASAVQVGTASFADPRAVGRVARELTQLVHQLGDPSIASLRGGP